MLLLTTVLPVKGGVWDSVFVHKDELQIQQADKIFENLSSTHDSAAVMTALNMLQKLAVINNSPNVEVASVFFKGSYQLDLKNNVFTPISTRYFKESLELAKKHELTELEISIMSTLGYTLFKSGKKEEGLTYMLQAYKMAEEVGFKNLSTAYQQLLFLALTYNNFANYDRGILYGEMALKYRKKSRPTTDIEIYNLLANAYKDKREYKKSLVYYTKAQQAGLKINAEAELATVNANMGQLYVKTGQYVEAKKVLQNAYRYSILSKCWDCLSYIWLSRIQAEIGLNNLKSAWKSQQELALLVQNHELDLHVLSEYFKQTALLYQLNKRYAEANLYLDTFYVIVDSLNQEKDANMLANLEAQISAEKYLADKVLLEKENNRQRVIRNASWMVSGMAILLLIGMIYGLRMRQQRKQRILELERQKAELEQLKAEEKLAHYRHRLGHYIGSIREKNRLIEQLRVEITRGSSSDVTGVSNNDMLEQLYDSIILTEDNWVEFKSVFEKVHPGFIRKVQHDYPDLTVAELRLLLLLKLGLDKQEMAAMLGISQESVRKARQRLRKKLALDSYKDIPGFIEEVSAPKLQIA